MHLSTPIRATCPAHHIILYFITRSILGEQYRSLSSSLCSFLHSPVTSSLLGPNISSSNYITCKELTNVFTQTLQKSVERFGSWHTQKNRQVLLSLYRVSQDECARIREGVPYVKIYRYNPKHLCLKLNGYGDNGQRKVWSSGGSTHCTCQLTSLIDVCPWVWCPIQLTLAVQLCSTLIPECAINHVTSVFAIQCHV